MNGEALQIVISVTKKISEMKANIDHTRYIVSLTICDVTFCKPQH